MSDTNTRQVDLDKAVEELNVLNNATPQDGEAIAKANAKVDALRKALAEPEVVRPEPAKPIEPIRPVTPFKKF